MGHLTDDLTAFRTHLAKAYPGKDQGYYNTVGVEFRQFVHEMKIGDLVIAEARVAHPDLVYFGQIASAYLYNPVLNADYPHVRRVSWLWTVPMEYLSPEVRRAVDHPVTVARIVTDADAARSIIAHLL